MRVVLVILFCFYSGYPKNTENTHTMFLVFSFVVLLYGGWIFPEAVRRNPLTSRACDLDLKAAAQHWLRFTRSKKKCSETTTAVMEVGQRAGAGGVARQHQLQPGTSAGGNAGQSSSFQWTPVQAGGFVGGQLGMFRSFTGATQQQPQPLQMVGLVGELGQFSNGPMAEQQHRGGMGERAGFRSAAGSQYLGYDAQSWWPTFYAPPCLLHICTKK